MTDVGSLAVGYLFVFSRSEEKPSCCSAFSELKFCGGETLGENDACVEKQMFTVRGVGVATGTIQSERVEKRCSVIHMTSQPL